MINIEKTNKKLVKENDTCDIKLQLESEERLNTTKISDARSVMDDFMKKLANDELVRDKEQPIQEIKLDDNFIYEQLESYRKLLKSPLIQELQGPSLVKTKTYQNSKSNN